MAQRGLFDSIGAIADSLNHSLGLDRVPWGWRMVIAFFLIDVVDIALRAITLPLLFAFPIASYAAHIVFNTVLAFACAALWGAPGLLHLIDVLFGMVPGIGGDILLDILPIASIAGFITLWRGEEKTAMAVGRQGGSMIGFTLWGITSVAMWWFGCVSIFSYGWIAATAIMFLVLSSAANVSPRGVACILLAVVIMIGFYFGYLSIISLESYREKTWIMLDNAGDSRIVAARKTDEVGEFANRSLETAFKAAKTATNTVSGAAGKIGSEVGKKIGSVLKGVKSDVPAWNKFAMWLGNKMDYEEKKSSVSAPSALEVVKPIEKAQVLEKVVLTITVNGKQLSPREVELYKSDYILQKAGEIRVGQICWAKNILILLCGLLFYAVANIVSGGSVNTSTLVNIPDDDPNI
jgi:hypothetical protein